MKNILIAICLSGAAGFGLSGCSEPSDTAGVAAETSIADSEAAEAPDASMDRTGVETPPAMPLPTYQMRAEAPPGGRLEAGRDGEALFEARCGACHLEMGMGTNLLVRQVVAAGMTPDKALLAAREDLDPAYVISVVRNGKVAMPRLSRVEVTDPELEAIAAYLSRNAE